MVSLEQRLEKAQARRNERLMTLQSTKKTDRNYKDLPSQKGSIGVPSMMDPGSERKAKPSVMRVTKPSLSKRSTTSAIGFNIGDKSKMIPKVYRQPSYWDAQGSGFQSRRRDQGKSTEALGFHLGDKNRAKLRPQWATKMMEAGLDPMMAVQGLTTNEVTAYLEDEGQMYQLTENEIIQLKHLVEVQLTLEADPDIGVIKGADEVLNLMARLAAVGGDLTELHPIDQAAVLTLIQFNNVIIGFGPMFDEDEIEADVDGSNNFVQYTDHTNTQVFIRKGSYAKAQILERKIEEEMKTFEYSDQMYFIFIIIMICIYLILKCLVLFTAIWMSGQSEGYSQAMATIGEMSEFNKIMI